MTSWITQDLHIRPSPPPDPEASAHIIAVFSVGLIEWQRCGEATGTGGALRPERADAYHGQFVFPDFTKMSFLSGDIP